MLRAFADFFGIGPANSRSRILTLGSGAVVVVQHAAQSLASLDRSISVYRNGLRSNEPVAKSLMISFQMIMGHELSNRFP